MTISGSSVHKNIKAKIVEVENDHDSLSNEVYKCESRIESLVQEREDCFAKLATAYLPEMNAQTVKLTLREVQKEVQNIFKTKQDRRKKVEELMYSSKEKKTKLENKLDGVTEQLNQKAAERDKLQGEVAKELTANKDYVNLHSQAVQAQKILEQNKKRVEEVKNESKQKLPPYEGNKIFMYLLKRNFGTKNYQGSGLVEKLDSWTAKSIDYAAAKKNYDFLRSMPELMELEVERRQDELDPLVKSLQKIEKDAAEKYGLTKVIEQGMQIGKLRNNLMSDIEKNNAEYNGYAQERKELDNTKGEYHKQAVQRLKAYLKGEDVASLKQKARATPGTEDDRLAARIEEIDGDVRRLKDKSKETKLKRDTIGDKLAELKNVLSRYKNKDYESDSSYFDKGFDINSLLIGYLGGRYSHDDIDTHIDNSHHFEEKSNWSYGGGDGGGGGGGGDIGGGIFSGGGGSFGGGSFSTTGGF